jgi:hypothetical protein
VRFADGEEALCLAARGRSSQGMGEISRAYQRSEVVNCTTAPSNMPEFAPKGVRLRYRAWHSGQSGVRRLGHARRLTA